MRSTSASQAIGENAFLPVAVPLLQKVAFEEKDAVRRLRGLWALHAVGGLTSVLWNVITVSLRQSIIPDPLLGRVNSVYRFLGWGTMPIGAAVGGALAKGFGLRAPFYVSAGVLAVMGVAALPVVNRRTIEAARAHDG